MSSTGLSAAKPQRVISIDIVRGITIAFMIMVNNNGGHGSWWFMNHAAWNGLTPTDLVFPTFLFLVGVSTVFGTEARLAKGAAKGELARHTVIRTVVLILLGILVNSFPYFHLAHIRIYGVLQRIAICYLVVGLFYLVDRRFWSKAALLIACVVGYWALVSFAPVPGAGMPGRDVPFLDKDQNIVAWADRQIMPGHLYEERGTHNTRDPEGLLSDIPAIGTALLGMMTGIFLRSSRSTKAKALGLIAGCVACLAIGYIWSVWFPLNKKMWTSSYVFVAAGYSLALLSVVYWVVEVNNWRKGWTWPWLVFGSNAIMAYMVSELLPGILDLFHVSDGGHAMSPAGWFFVHVCAKIPDPGWAAFSWSVLFTAVCFIPVWVLYRKRIFVKV
ncbi:acyltransferase family protein [Terracidiphilus sp.]|jgi:predicted acyltransferase|uniref:acyltransferase family protein n=1 Tax=Terracidiphilus sp. TaxID=1964191 RepID=UPI003C16128D